MDDELLNGVIVKSSRARFDVDVASVDEVPAAITDDSLFTMQKIETSNVVHVRVVFPHLSLATLIYWTSENKMCTIRFS